MVDLASYQSILDSVRPFGRRGQNHFFPSGFEKWKHAIISCFHSPSDDDVSSLKKTLYLRDYSIKDKTKTWRVRGMVDLASYQRILDSSKPFGRRGQSQSFPSELKKMKKKEEKKNFNFFELNGF